MNIQPLEGTITSDLYNYLGHINGEDISYAANCVAYLPDELWKDSNQLKAPDLLNAGLANKLLQLLELAFQNPAEPPQPKDDPSHEYLMGRNVVRCLRSLITALDTLPDKQREVTKQLAASLAQLLDTYSNTSDGLYRLTSCCLELARSSDVLLPMVAAAMQETKLLSKLLSKLNPSSPLDQVSVQQLLSTLQKLAYMSDMGPLSLAQQKALSALPQDALPLLTRLLDANFPAVVAAAVAGLEQLLTYNFMVVIPIRDQLLSADYQKKLAKLLSSCMTPSGAVDASYAPQLAACLSLATALVKCAFQVGTDAVASVMGLHVSGAKAAVRLLDLAPVLDALNGSLAVLKKECILRTDRPAEIRLQGLEYATALLQLLSRSDCDKDLCIEVCRLCSQLSRSIPQDPYVPKASNANAGANSKSPAAKFLGGNRATAAAAKPGGSKTAATADSSSGKDVSAAVAEVVFKGAAALGELIAKGRDEPFGLSNRAIDLIKVYADIEFNKPLLAPSYKLCSCNLFTSGTMDKFRRLMITIDQARADNKYNAENALDNAVSLVSQLCRDYPDARLYVRDMGWVPYLVNLVKDSPYTETYVMCNMQLARSEQLQLALLEAGVMDAMGLTLSKGSYNGNTRTAALVTVAHVLDAADEADSAHGRSLLDQYNVSDNVAACLQTACTEGQGEIGGRWWQLPTMVQASQSLSKSSQYASSLVQKGVHKYLITALGNQFGRQANTLVYIMRTFLNMSMNKLLHKDLIAAGIKDAVQEFVTYSADMRVADAARGCLLQLGLLADAEAMRTQEASTGSTTHTDSTLPSAIVSQPSNAENGAAAEKKGYEDEPEYEVFLSHKRSDAKDFARALYNLLVLRGITTFLDFEYREELSGLAGVVSKCENLIFIMTDNIFDSQWCRLELETAINSGVNVILVTKDGARWKDESGNPTCIFPPEHILATLPKNVHDFVSAHKAVAHSDEYYQAFVEQLLTKIKRLPPKLSAPQPDSLPSPSSTSTSTPQAVAGPAVTVPISPAAAATAIPQPPSAQSASTASKPAAYGALPAVSPPNGRPLRAVAGANSVSLPTPAAPPVVNGYIGQAAGTGTDYVGDMGLLRREVTAEVATIGRLVRTEVASQFEGVQRQQQALSEELARLRKSVAAELAGMQRGIAEVAAGMQAMQAAMGVSSAGRKVGTSWDGASVGGRPWRSPARAPVPADVPSSADSTAVFTPRGDDYAGNGIPLELQLPSREGSHKNLGEKGLPLLPMIQPSPRPGVSRASSSHSTLYD